ncbi:hypothetical protein, partial [Daejeonella sp.]|uniref:hypothetical protein n=1 Tax=Daejeonella sp. TaxID=2805397 RepID=UPI00272F55E0
ALFQNRSYQISLCEGRFSRFKTGTSASKIKKSSRFIQMAHPSIRFWGHTRNAIIFKYPPKAAIAFF